MWLDKVEDMYKKHEGIVKTIAALSIGTVVGMWVYGKYKESKVSKELEKVDKVATQINELKEDISKIKEEM